MDNLYGADGISEEKTMNSECKSYKEDVYNNYGGIDRIDKSNNSFVEKRLTENNIIELESNKYSERKYDCEESFDNINVLDPSLGDKGIILDIKTVAGSSDVAEGKYDSEVCNFSEDTLKNVQNDRVIADLIFSDESKTDSVNLSSIHNCSNNSSISLKGSDGRFTPLPTDFKNLPLPLSDDSIVLVDDNNNSNNSSKRNSFAERDRSNHKRSSFTHSTHSVEEEVIIKDNNINNKLTTIEEEDESTKINIPESKINEEESSHFTLQKSYLIYNYGEAEKIYQDYESRNKVTCCKDKKQTTKLNCFKIKGKNEYICVNCVKKGKENDICLEDWCDYSKDKIDDFEKCSKCNCYKPPFVYLRRSKKDTNSFAKTKMCLFCRNKKKLENNSSRQDSIPFAKFNLCSLPPISIPDISLIDDCDELVNIDEITLRNELEEFINNKRKMLNCNYCGKDSIAVEGVKYNDKFFCGRCYLIIVRDGYITVKEGGKEVKKEIKKSEFTDPVYEGFIKKIYEYLITCTRCNYYKRIASHIYYNKSKRISVSKYCRCCALKK